MFIVILMRKKRRDSLTLLRSLFPQFFQSNHKYLEFKTGAYEMEVVAMWLRMFELGAGWRKC